MENRKTYRFSDFVEINPSVRLQSSNDYSFVEMKDLSESNKFTTPSAKRILSGGARFENGDTLFARITPCLENGKICQVKDLENGVGFGSTEFLVFRGKKGVSISEFVFYLSRYDEVRKFGEKNMSGTSGRQRVNREAFNNLYLKLPPIEEQKAIAKILSSLDDKIELNRRMNATLEAMARAIFKAWFVDFEPVHANKENRSSTSASPEIAELFPSEIENAIPKGWQRNRINQLAKNIQYGFTQSSTSDEVGPKFLRITDIQGGRINWDKVPYCEINETDFQKYKIQNHDIFIARTGASTGENVYVIDSPEAVFASYLIRVQFDDPALAFYFGKFFRGIEYFDYVASILGGSAQPNANAQKLTNVEVPVPNSNVIRAYFEICYALESKKSANDNENIKLSEIRDSLLPKLMSNEVHVGV